MAGLSYFLRHLALLPHLDPSTGSQSELLSWSCLFLYLDGIPSSASAVFPCL